VPIHGDQAEQGRLGGAAPTFEEAARDYGPALWRLAGTYSQTASDREDLYQEILVAVWRALPHFEGRSSIRTYVLRIGHNRGLSHRARRWRATMHDSESVDNVPDPAPPPDESIDRTLTRERLLAAVRRLSPALSQTVTLSLEGLSSAEIADVLGITENNVNVRMNRARGALARLFDMESAP
jgi:RNA polymerase sigma-70 factor (ECF subfamily)